MGVYRYISIKCFIAMKKLQLLLNLLCIASIVYAQSGEHPNLQMSPAKARPGELITLSYSPIATLNNAQTIYAVVHFNKNQTFVTHEVTLTKDDQLWKGSFQVPDTIKSLVLYFTDDAQRDINNDSWYTAVLHDGSGKPLPGAQSELAYSLMHTYLVKKTETLTKKAALLYEKEFELYPEALEDPENLRVYIKTISKDKQEQAKSLSKKLSAMLAKSSTLSEAQLSFLVNYYTEERSEQKAAYYQKQLDELFPQEDEAQAEAANQINKEQDFTKAKALAAAFKAKYPNSSHLELMYFNLAQRSIKDGLVDDFEQLISAIPYEITVSTLLSYAAENWATKKEHLDKAEAYSKKSWSFYQQRISQPIKDKIPTIMTERQYKLREENSFAFHSHVYGFVLLQQDRYEEAIPRLKDAVSFAKGKSSKYNQTYAIALSKAKDNSTLKSDLEGFIKTGSATAQIRDILKEAHLKEEGNNEATWSAYLADLEQINRARAKKDLQQKLIKEKAPAFALQNLGDNEVSLSSLQGKIIIVDFWATWCGPCIQSFPGMQMAINRFKDDPNVAFLFINSWERVQDKKKQVNDFMAKRDFTFHILMDDDDAVINSFGVSGIPTKFIIDKNGDIRFKSIGYHGSSEAIADEISLMVEILNEINE
jgi:peroxiredoxin